MWGVVPRHLVRAGVPGHSAHAVAAGKGHPRAYARGKKSVTPIGAQEKRATGTQAAGGRTFAESPQGMKESSLGRQPVEPKAQIRSSPRKGRHKMKHTSCARFSPEQPVLELNPRRGTRGSCSESATEIQPHPFETMLLCFRRVCTGPPCEKPGRGDYSGYSSGSISI
jgi:hypothetical protein